MKDNRQSEWLDMEMLSEFCKDKHILLQGNVPTAQELETELMPFFKQIDELYADGVNVIWNNCRVGWELIFMVRFYRYNPEHLSALKSNLVTQEAA